MYHKKIYCNCMYHGNHKMRMMAAIVIGSDCTSIGIVINLITISLDCAFMDVDNGFDGGFNGQFDGWFDGGFNGEFNIN